MSPVPKLVAFGQTSIDTIVNENGLALDLLGGPALGVAVVASHLGTRCGLVTRIGSDFPTSLLRLLSRVNVDLSGIRRYAGLTTRIFLTYHGPRLIYLKIHEGVSSRQTEEDFIDSYFNARLVHIGPAPFSSQVRLSRLLRQRDISVSFDPHSQYDEMSSKRAQRMLKNVSLLFCNETEARNISKRPTVMSAANRILRSGPSLLVVTLGGRGAIAYTRERTLRILPAKAHRIVDYVGAGDSFAAGFLTAFLQNKDLEECGRQGATVAAKKLQDYGLRVFLDMGRVLRYG